jgi:hypothetical protein
MTSCKECLNSNINSDSNSRSRSNSNSDSSQNSNSKSSLGRIIAQTRPGRANIYLDGEVVLDPSGKMAKTPTVVHNVTEGMHTVTFSKPGYSDITIIANVPKGNDCHARALLNTSMFAYPMMLAEDTNILEQSFSIDTSLQLSEQQLQPSPGWPYIPVRQVTYGHMVTSTIPDEAEIYLDGQPVLDINGNIAKTPSSVTGIITGIHTVTFKKAGYVDTSVTIDVQNGLYSDARATLHPST